MDDAHNIQYCNLQDNAQAEQKLDNAQATMAATEEEEATTTSKAEYGSGIPSPLQSPERACSPSVALASIPEGPFEEASTNQVEDLEDPLRMFYNALNIKVYDLVDFLLFKYQMKAFTTKAEMLETIGREYDEYYPLIFSEASECMKLVFGLDIVEVDPSVHSYVLVTALGITYDGMLTDVQGMPKTGLLIIVLGVICMHDHHAHEDEIWQSLNTMGVISMENHYVAGNAKKLFTETFVQEGYLKYNLVPDSDPPHYEFLWGPRAHAETRSTDVIEFLVQISRIN